MTKEEKLQKIYEVIANKTLSPGCVITAYDCEGEHGEHIIKKNYIIYSVSSLFKGDMCAYLEGDEFDVRSIFEGDLGDIIIGEHSYDYKVIGHPIMIGDVLDGKNSGGSNIVAVESNHYGNIEVYEGNLEWLRLLEMRSKGDLKKPIDDQSEECIDYVLSLIE